MARPKSVALGVVGLAALAWTDTYFGWSTPVPGFGATAPAEAVVIDPPPPSGGEWSAPFPGDQWAKAKTNHPHHDYPAWDQPVPVGTPVYAIRGGRAWHTRGWQCGTGIEITDSQGARWVYCHGSRHSIDNGVTVTAGQQILASGSSGHSTGPHLHLEIRVAGANHCPQPLLNALRHFGTGLDPSSLPTAGCSS